MYQLCPDQYSHLNIKQSPRTTQTRAGFSLGATNLAARSGISQVCLWFGSGEEQFKEQPSGSYILLVAKEFLPIKAAVSLVGPGVGLSAVIICRHYYLENKSICNGSLEGEWGS